MTRQSYLHPSLYCIKFSFYTIRIYVLSGTLFSANLRKITVLNIPYNNFGGTYLKVVTLPLGSLQTNCYIVYDEMSLDAVVIDPADDADTILSVLHEHRLKLQLVLLTHGHFDHMMAIDPLLDATSAAFALSAADEPMLRDDQLNCMASLHGGHFTVKHKPDALLRDGDKIELRDLVIEVFETPGHTAGSLTYRICDSLFTGDLLFYLMVGRMDLPTGSFTALKKSLVRIGKLDGDYQIYPGHSIATTLAFERENNIYMKHLLSRKAES